MSEKQDVFDLTELDTISFECRACGTEIAFRADNDKFGKGQKKQCPCCNADLAGVDMVVDAYRKLQADVKRMQLTVKLKGPKTKA